MTDHQAEVLRACNRHMARLLSNLEDAQCPKVHCEIVKREMQWLRHDLLQMAANSDVPPLTTPRYEW